MMPKFDDAEKRNATQGPANLHQKSIFGEKNGKRGQFSPKVDKSRVTAPRTGSG